MDSFERRAYTLLVGLFVGGLVSAAIISCKIITAFGIAFPAGVLAYSITFAISDIVGELWGPKVATDMVVAGFVALVCATIICWLAVIWPAAGYWQNQPAFASVIGSTPRIVAASLLAYVVSQKHDVWLFHVLKKRTSGRVLWLRNNLSTAISQLMDSAIFVTVAFWGVMPVGEIILGQWIIKLLIAALDTPVVYAGVYMLRKGHRGMVPEAS